MTEEIKTYNFRGTDIRTLTASEDMVWLNVNDVYQAFGLGWPDSTDTKMMDAIDVHRFAKQCNNEVTEDFIVWLVEQVHYNPAGLPPPEEFELD